jgi:hypothetical protein
VPVTGLLGALLVVASLLLVPRPAAAEIMCDWFFRCLYESPGFRFRVVDAETKQPLADVYALAEWVLNGHQGRNGPLMVQEAVSGADGWIEFPAWGPTTGSRAGLVLNHDPAIVLFKPAYKVSLIQNAYPGGTTETTRLRRFGQDGQGITLQPFRGTSIEWMEELRKAVSEPNHGRASPEQIEPFRNAFLTRLTRVRSEVEKIAKLNREFQNFLSALERETKYLMEGPMRQP